MPSGVDIATTSLWLAKDIGWATRLVPIAYSFGILAVIFQGKNLRSVLTHAHTKAKITTTTTTTTTTSRLVWHLLLASSMEIALILWLLSNFIWCVSELQHEHFNPETWYPAHGRGRLISVSAYNTLQWTMRVTFMIATALALLKMFAPLTSLSSAQQSRSSSSDTHNMLGGGGGGGGSTEDDEDDGRGVTLENVFITTWIVKDLFWSIRDITHSTLRMMAQVFGVGAWIGAVAVLVVGWRSKSATVTLWETLSNLAHVAWISGNLFWMTGELWFSEEADKPADNIPRTIAICFQALGLLVCLYSMYRGHAQDHIIDHEQDRERERRASLSTANKTSMSVDDDDGGGGGGDYEREEMHHMAAAGGGDDDDALIEVANVDTTHSVN